MRIAQIKPVALTSLAAFALSFGAAPATPKEISCSAGTYFTQTLSGSLPALPAMPILRFVNLSDSHILDDEGSPVITGNYLEAALEPTIGNNSAQRLQEEYTDEVLNAMIKTINACNSASTPLELMIATGDLTDNMTLNETRRYIDNLDGVIYQDTAYEANCGYLTVDSNGNDKLDGELPECPPELLEKLKIPTGKLVSDSQAPEPDLDDPAYQLAPTRSALQIAGTLAASVEHGSHFTAPGLPASLRCNAGPGCDNAKLAIPHYAVFGNHDGSVRGTVTMQRPFQAGPASVGRYFFQSQREFVNEWFKTQSSPGPIGHGFNNAGDRLDDADDRNDGWYAFNAGANGSARMIVVNTIWDGVIGGVHRNGQTNEQTKGLLGGNEVTNAIGVEQGWVSAEQYAWLESELAGAAAAGQPALVFSHHPDRSFADRRLGGRTPDLFEGAKTAVQVDELLGRASFADPNDATVEHPNTLVAWIAGHTHENVITACKPGLNGCPLGGSGGQPTIARGFWRVETSSLIDYPQEGRIVELYALQGGYGLKLTMISPDPNDPTSTLSHELSIAEAECKTSAIMGGPPSSGPYDQSRLETFAYNAGEAAIRQKFCVGNFAEAAGLAKDRDVILLP